MFIRRFSIGIAAFCCAAAAYAQPAQNFPAKPVQIIVPYAAGGVTDILARIVALRLTDKWKQPVIVDNRPGAGTVIGTAAAARAPGDGHTLLITAFGYTARRPWRRCPSWPTPTVISTSIRLCPPTTCRS